MRHAADATPPEATPESAGTIRLSETEERIGRALSRSGEEHGAAVLDEYEIARRKRIAARERLLSGGKNGVAERTDSAGGEDRKSREAT